MLEKKILCSLKAQKNEILFVTIELNYYSQYC